MVIWHLGPNGSSYIAGNTCEFELFKSDGWSHLSEVASEGRLLFEKGDLQRWRLAPRSCSDAAIIMWNACDGWRGAEIAKASPGLLKEMLAANCMHMVIGRTALDYRLVSPTMSQLLKWQK